MYGGNSVTRDRMRGGEVQEEEVGRLEAQATRGTRIQAEELGFHFLIPFSASFIMDPATSKVPSTHSALMLGLGGWRQTHTTFRTVVSGRCCHSCPLHLGLWADFVPSTGQNPSCALSPWVRRLVGGELGIRLFVMGGPGSPLPNQNVPKPSVHHKPQS